MIRSSAAGDPGADLKDVSEVRVERNERAVFQTADVREAPVRRAAVSLIEYGHGVVPGLAEQVSEFHPQVLIQLEAHELHWQLDYSLFCQFRRVTNCRMDGFGRDRRI